MNTFRKTMTRDNGLILQQTWSYAFVSGWEKTSGLKNPYLPPLIYYVNQGATEIWEHDESFAWFKDSLLAKNQKGPDFFNTHFEAYKTLLKKMEVYRKSRTLPFSLLQELVRDMFEASRLFVVFYYSSYDERTPEVLKEKALRWRRQDKLFDTHERIVKQSLSTIEPRLKNMELVVTIADLETIPDNDVLQKRLQHSVFIPGSPIEAIDLKSFLDQHPEYHFVFDSVSENNKRIGFVKGVAAMDGHATGRVRILRRKMQVADLQEGEILISPMTTPDFIPAMKRSSAIVTDEGGITCHAAIVSRELKKPCVIGTKVATQIIKDGDEVEVDATTGVVKKI